MKKGLEVWPDCVPTWWQATRQRCSKAFLKFVFGREARMRETKRSSALYPPRTHSIPQKRFIVRLRNMKTEINACPFLRSAMCLLCRMREHTSIDVESFRKMCFLVSLASLGLVIEGSCDDNQISHQLSHVSRKKNCKTTSESHAAGLWRIIARHHLALMMPTKKKEGN